MTRLLLLAAAVLFLLARPARADDVSDAREHFKKGQTHYSLGEFTEAVTEFREAYRLRNEPAILFNIAQAMRQVGQYKLAYFYYGQYLHQRPDAPNRFEVETFMAAMKRKVDADEESEKAHAEADAARPGQTRFPEDHLVEDDERRADAGAAKDGKGAAAKEEKGVAAKEGKGVAAKDEKGAAAKDAKGVAAKEDKGVAVKAAKGAADPTGAKVAKAVSAPSAALPAQQAVQPAAGPKATRIAGFVALGAGAAAEGLAFVFHQGAQSAANQIAQQYASSGGLTAADAHLRSDVDSKGKLATVAALGGAALLVAGAVLTFAF